MSRKFIPVLLVLTAAGFFIANQTLGGSNGDEPNTRYQRILRNTGLLLEEGHFSPKKIDDAFSRLVMKEFLKDLDPEKSVFLQSDIKDFKKVEDNIDNEIKGAEIKSFYLIRERYKQRFDEITKLYPAMLKEPINFSKDETILMDYDKLNYANTEAERKDLWRKRIKYMVLDRYSIALDDREKNKSKKDFVTKADTTLEREARETVQRQLDRMFTTKRNRETSDNLFGTFVNNIATSMELHTNYFPPVELRSFNESMSGTFFGIGAQLKEEEGKVKIGPLQTGMPAQKSGLITEGDEVMKVGQADEEPVDVTGYDVQEVVKLIRGEKLGSTVKLTLRKLDGSIKVVPLQRGKISLDNTFVQSYILNGENKLGYIYLPEFYINSNNDPNGRRSATDVAEEIKKLKAENVQGIILDLRGNGGGSLWDVVQMAGYFIESGPIVQVKSRDQKANALPDRDKSVLWDGPLTVMVDETSASASEIFAAAIQDYKRGLVIGSTSTYGKGTVQRNIPLNPQSEGIFGKNTNEEDLGTVKLTLQKFYRINGDATQRKGVQSDVVLPDRLEYIKFRERDNELALPWDGIKPVPYTPWTSTYSLSDVVKAANESVANNTTFNQIKTNVQWLEKNSDKSYSLNLAKYRKQRKELNEVFRQLDTLYKLPVPMAVNNLHADLSTITSTKEKDERNKEFMKRVAQDIFINETAKIMNNMIGKEALAKKN